MKKMMIALAIAAMAVGAYSDLVDGSMDGVIHRGDAIPYNTSQDTVDSQNNLLDKGWITGDTLSLPSFNIGSGYAFLAHTSSTQKGIAQFFSSTLTGMQTLSFDVNYDVNSGLGQQSWNVQIIGFNDADDSFSINMTSSASNLSSTNVDSWSGWIVGQSYSLTTDASSGGFVNYDLAADFGAGGWEYYVVRFGTANMVGNGSVYGLSSDVFQVDNVQIVPEPATVGMLGLGALITMLIRRIRS